MSIPNSQSQDSGRTPPLRPLRGLRGVRDEVLDTANWPTPDEAGLPNEKRRAYLARKRAVLLFFDGSTAETVRAKTGVSLEHIRRLIKDRCIQSHPDGRLWGWRGLVPELRIHGYARRRQVRPNKWGQGASGALGATFLRCAEIKLEERFTAKILSAARAAADTPAAPPLREAKVAKFALFRWFLEELRRLQFEVKGEWPFNTERQGYVTICRYIDRVLSENPRAMVSREGGNDGLKKMRTGDGVDRPIFRPFQRVECDAHKKDGRFIVLVPTPDGEYVERLVRRLWVIVILEVVSRSVLGYYLSFRREVSSDDVLAAIKSALGKWHKRDVIFSENAYHPDAGFPSSVAPGLVGACWDEFSVDGALAETCTRVASKLEEVVGAKIVSPYNSFAKRRTPDDRPFIESFFRTLEHKGLQRLSVSTGGKPADKKGRDPAKNAVASRFQLEYAEELLDVTIANYNATPHSSLPNRSPLQSLQVKLSSGRLEVRQADPKEVEMFLSTRVLCCVHGAAKSGRRPYVTYKNARYTSDILGRRYDLVGDYIWIIQHRENDARFVMASTQDGQDLGMLRAAPPWHRTPHSVYVRAACMALARKRLIYLATNTDPIEQLIDYAERESNKKLPPHPAYLEARRILARYAEEMEGQPMAEIARARLAELAPAPSGSKAVVPAPAESPLPLRRKVVQR